MQSITLHGVEIKGNEIGDKRKIAIKAILNVRVPNAAPKPAPRGASIKTANSAFYT